MDIHRLRIVPYPASPINAVAFSHDPSPAHQTPRTLRLSVGRANGDIEIWNPADGRWVQERILRGEQGRSIEGLAWTRDPLYEDAEGQASSNSKPKWLGGRLRLFSIGYSSVITEWDVTALSPLRHSNGGESEVWCLDAQPRAGLPTPTDSTTAANEEYHQKLVVGCADGTLVLHSTAGDDLKYLRTLPPPPSQKARALSVTWQSVDRVVAGYSDNAIRVYDIRGRGRNVHTMSIASAARRGAQEVLVWAVRCLPDGTIVSGDSSGEVKIWDAKTLSLLQQLKSHNADVLALSPSLDGSTMLSGGIDRRTVTYRRVPAGPKRSRWAAVSHRRVHVSDVKCMTSFEAKDLSVVVSGGLDATPIVLPRSGSGLEHHRRLAVHPNVPPLHSAPAERLVMSYWGAEVRVWRIGRYESEASQPRGRDLSHRLVAKLELQGSETISAATMAQNGSLLAVSTFSTTKLFHLSETTKSALRVEKLDIPAAMAKRGSSLLCFSPDAKWLLQVQSDSDPVLARMRGDETFRIESQIVKLERKERAAYKFKARDGTHGNYTKSIQRVAWSSNSRILVACDMQGHFDSWVLQGHEDLLQSNGNLEAVNRDGGASDGSLSEDEGPVVVLGQVWVRLSSGLPKLGACPLVMSFRPEHPLHEDKTVKTPRPTRHNPHPHSHNVPEGEDRLMVVSCQHQLFEYNVMRGAFTDWTRRNPPQILPQEFQNIRERAMGCIWDVLGTQERIWLYGSSWLWMFNLATDLQPLAAAKNAGTLDSLSPKKRKREPSAAEVHELMQSTSGAGSRVPRAEQDSGIMPALLETQDEATEWVSLEPGATEDRNGPPSDEALNPELVEMRRHGRLENGTNGTHGDTIMTNGDDSEHDDSGDYPRGPVRHWGTFKYRPILGIVPIGAPEEPGNIEVALVERPLWDVDLPPRWEGDQEWNK